MNTFIFKLDSAQKLLMYSKCKEKYSEGLKISQISRALDLDRKTVRKYVNMDGDAFLSSESYKRHYTTILSPYADTIKDWLVEEPDLSASQVHDWLRERYPDLPSVCSKTVYNMVERIRSENGISKTTPSAREYYHVEETEYGEYAQVDFGETWMSHSDNRRTKVYFFAMVLSRSRKKFVWFNVVPFNTSLAVYAHELAFAYYGGKPHKILYDQDSVFIKSENQGYYLLTTGFQSFVSREKFQPVFCRKADPESKGMVENMVKYVKCNFLRGRRFTTVDDLNAQAIKWLSRTANGIVHCGTNKIPDEVFEEEKAHLVPYAGVPVRPDSPMSEYAVSKCNYIKYHGSLYYLPRGTYAGHGTKVFVDDSSPGTIDIYLKETGKKVVTYDIAETRGSSVISPEFKARRYKGREQKESEILDRMSGSKVVESWLRGAREFQGGRYYYDCVTYLCSEMGKYTDASLSEAFDEFLSRGHYNSHDLISYCDRHGGRKPAPKAEDVLPDRLPEAARSVPAKTDITEFEKFFK